MINVEQNYMKRQIRTISVADLYEYYISKKITLSDKVKFWSLYNSELLIESIFHNEFLPNIIVQQTILNNNLQYNCVHGSQIVKTIIDFIEGKFKVGILKDNLSSDVMEEIDSYDFDDPLITDYKMFNELSEDLKHQFLHYSLHMQVISDYKKNLDSIFEKHHALF